MAFMSHSPLVTLSITTLPICVNILSVTLIFYNAECCYTIMLCVMCHGAPYGASIDVTIIWQWWIYLQWISTLYYTVILSNTISFALPHGAQCCKYLTILSCTCRKINYRLVCMCTLHEPCFLNIQTYFAVAVNYNCKLFKTLIWWPT